MASGRHVCAASATFTTTVSSTCCLSGTTYAYQDSSSCLSASPVSCTATTNGGGFINTGLTTNSTAQMVRGNCGSTPAALNIAGTVQVGCTTTGSGTTATSTVTISQPTQVFSGAMTRTFYAGCVAPSGTNRCSLTNFGASTCPSSTTVRSCGGTLAGSTTVKLSCVCSSVRWIVASTTTAPAYFGFERTSAGTCPV